MNSFLTVMNGPRQGETYPTSSRKNIRLLSDDFRTCIYDVRGSELWFLGYEDELQNNSCAVPLNG